MTDPNTNGARGGEADIVDATLDFAGFRDEPADAAAAPASDADAALFMVPEVPPTPRAATAAPPDGGRLTGGGAVTPPPRKPRAESIKQPPAPPKEKNNRPQPHPNAVRYVITATDGHDKDAVQFEVHGRRSDEELEQITFERTGGRLGEYRVEEFRPRKAHDPDSEKALQYHYFEIVDEEDDDDEPEGHAPGLPYDDTDRDDELGYDDGDDSDDDGELGGADDYVNAPFDEREPAYDDDRPRRRERRRVSRHDTRSREHEHSHVAQVPQPPAVQPPRSAVAQPPVVPQKTGDPSIDRWIGLAAVVAPFFTAWMERNDRKLEFELNRANAQAAQTPQMLQTMVALTKDMRQPGILEYATFAATLGAQLAPAMRSNYAQPQQQPQAPPQQQQHTQQAPPLPQPPGATPPPQQHEQPRLGAPSTYAEFWAAVREMAWSNAPIEQMLPTSWLGAVFRLPAREQARFLNAPASAIVADMETVGDWPMPREGRAVWVEQLQQEMQRIIGEARAIMAANAAGEDATAESGASGGSDATDNPSAPE